MAKRAVLKTGKDKDGDITSLCDDGSSWSPVSKAQAIQDIEGGTHSYYVPWKSGRTEIRVVSTARSRAVIICGLTATRQARTTWTNFRIADLRRDGGLG
jgi:hypothetical protein